MGVLVNVVFGQWLIILKKKKKKEKWKFNRPRASCCWALGQLHGKHCGGPRGGHQGWQGWWEQQTEPYMRHECCLQGPLPQEGLEVCRDLPTGCSSPARTAEPRGTPDPTALSLARGSLAQLQPGLLPCFAPWEADAEKRYGRLLTWGKVRQVPREGKSLSRKSSNEQKTCTQLLEISLKTFLSLPLAPIYSLILQSSLTSINHRWPPHLSFNGLTVFSEVSHLHLDILHCCYDGLNIFL